MPSLAHPAPWGKLDRTAPHRETADRLSLVGHCIDVAAVANDLNPEAKTRLGLDGIDLDLPVEVRSPFQQVIGKLTVPAWMFPQWPAGVTPALPVVEGLQALEGGLRFSVRGQPLRYDRHGLAQDGPRRQ